MDKTTTESNDNINSHFDFNESATEIREDLVGKAFKFLQNPKVRRSPLSQKKAFLEEKGLTSSEIEIALTKAGEIYAISNGNNFQRFSPAPHHCFQTNEISRWSLIRDYCEIIAFIGGAAYGIFHLVKKYLLPYLTGVPNDEERRLNKLETQFNVLQSLLNQMMDQQGVTLTVLHETLQQLNKKQDAIGASVAVRLENNNLEAQFDKLNSEIASVKGLLLNRHQFPPTPSITPMIPTWQMSSSTTITEGQSDNKMLTEKNDVDESI